MLLCFTFLLGQVGNYVLVGGKGARTEIQAWKDFLCCFGFFLFGFEGWGVEPAMCGRGLSHELFLGAYFTAAY